MDVKVGQTVRLRHKIASDYIVKVTLVGGNYIAGIDVRTNETEVWYGYNSYYNLEVLLEPHQDFVDPKSFLAAGLTVPVEDQIRIYKILHPEAHDVCSHETGYLVVTQNPKTAIVAFGDEDGTTTILFTNREGKKLRFEKRNACLELGSDEVRQVFEHFGVKYES